LIVTVGQSRHRTSGGIAETQAQVYPSDFLHTLMAIKESSDELNPTAITGDKVAVSGRAARSATDYLALAVATCGVGYLPLAPGTWGSLVGVGLYLLLRLFIFPKIGTEGNQAFYSPAFLILEASVIAIITLAGVWAASRTERVLRIKDPGKVVVDEVAGQLIALLPVPLAVETGWPYWLIPAFLLFRFFDIVKPYPARKFESLHGGLGIMADDLVAGIYAAIVIGVAFLISFFI
jgi:phosphatidylglycerophosphatase A